MLDNIDHILALQILEGVLLDLLTKYKPLIEVLTLVFLIIYVVKTASLARSSHVSAEVSRKILDEMKAQREAETRPHIVAYFEIQIHSSVVDIVVKNIGRSIAENVKLKFTPQLKSSFKSDLGSNLWANEGLGSMPPGKEIRTFFDFSHSLFGNDDIPKSYMVKVDYSGGIEATGYSDTQAMDLNPYKHISSITRHTMHDLVKEVKESVKYEGDIAKSLKTIETRLQKGLFINSNINYAAIFSSDVSIKGLEYKLREVENFLSFIIGANKHTVYKYDLHAIDAKIKFFIEHIEVLLSFVSNQLSKPQDETVQLIIKTMSEFSSDRIPNGSDYFDRYKESLREIKRFISQFFEENGDSGMDS